MLEHSALLHSNRYHILTNYQNVLEPELIEKTSECCLLNSPAFHSTNRNYVSNVKSVTFLDSNVDLDSEKSPGSHATNGSYVSNVKSVTFLDRNVDLDSNVLDYDPEPVASKHMHQNLVSANSSSVPQPDLPCKQLKATLPEFISCKCLNVAGLHGKLDRGILDAEMSFHDLVIFSETHTDRPDFSHTMLRNHACFTKEKPKLTSTNYKYGGIHGICVLAGSRFDANECSIINGTKSECILWIKLRVKNFTFILGALYIPCSSSKFYFDSVFDQIQEDLMDLRPRNLPILLAGDCNSHVALLRDYIESDKNIAEVTGCIFLEEDCTEILENLKLPLNRASQDNMPVDCNGRKLISLCQAFDMFIMNGRLGNDRNLGRATCFKGQPSITDYAIASSDMLKHMYNFEVDIFDPMISDVHAPIEFTICIDPIPGTPVPTTFTSSGEMDDTENHSPESVLPTYNFKWSSEGKSNFKEKMNSFDVKSLVKDLAALALNPTQAGVDKICTDLNDQIIQIAKTTKVLVEKKTHNSSQKSCQKRLNKPWMDDDFRSKREEYYKVKNRLKHAHQNKMCNKKAKEMAALSKNKRKAFRDTLHKDIRTLRKSNSKAYWLLLQQSTEGAQARSKISLQTFLKHFKKLNEAHDNSSPADSSCNFVNSESNVALNYAFTSEEIKEIIFSLKNNKACGLDLLRNEFLKQSSDDLVNFYSLFFNFILDTGLVPDIWCKGLIMPLFKKGDRSDPDNYRGITLLSCMGKLFTACINKRITSFMDEDQKLGPEQAGFREEFSTLDHVFTLYSIIEFYRTRKGRVYCAFIDYTKAFDLITRSSLWLKLLNNGVNGKILDVIVAMYTNAKSCVKSDSNISEFFSCNKGVRQGENLSPILFAIYLNDFNEFISDNCEGLSMLSDCFQSELEIYLRLYVLLYADDTIILAETAEDLQMALNALHEYCSKWDLKVSISKTKIIIFSRGRVKKFPEFRIGNETVEVVDDYIYLGVTFNYNGSFIKAMNKQVSQARKAMFAILQKSRQLYLPIDIVCELYERCVIPILLYGCEIWGFENLHCLEIFHRNFLRRILKSFNFTPNCMLYGETNTTDILTKVEIRMGNFWLRTKFSSKLKISVAMCAFLSSLYDSHPEPRLRWPAKIKEILSSTDLHYMWDDPSINVPSSKLLLKNKLSDKFLDRWKKAVDSNSQCSIYRLFKLTPKFEQYVYELKGSLLFSFHHFVTRVHHLPVTVDRFQKSLAINTSCPLCNLNALGDENHYLFSCPALDSQRQLYLPPALLHIPISSHGEAWKAIMNLEKTDLINIAKFTRSIMSNFKYEREESEVPSITPTTTVTRTGRTVKAPQKLDL